MEMVYRLTGTGWSEAEVSHDGSRVTLTASYLSDALGDLLEAADLALAGADEARCSWEEEPGEYRWILTRTGSDVGVRVLAFGDYAQEPDTAGHLVFEATLPVAELAAAIADAAQRVLDEHGADGYLARWVEHPFPTEALTRVQARLTGA